MDGVLDGVLDGVVFVSVTAGASLGLGGGKARCEGGHAAAEGRRFDGSRLVFNFNRGFLGASGCRIEVMEGERNWGSTTRTAENVIALLSLLTRPVKLPKKGCLSGLLLETCTTSCTKLRGGGGRSATAVTG